MNRETRTDRATIGTRMGLPWWLFLGLLCLTGCPPMPERPLVADGDPDGDADRAEEPAEADIEEEGPPSIGDMVDGGGFLIDSYEVTRDQYRAFLESAPSATTDPACLWNTDYQPGCEWGERGDLPAVCLDWCDARDYCLSLGKRLCGGTWDDPASDEWLRACQGEEANPYPYGTEYDPAACNGADSGVEWLKPVGSFPTCEGGLSGLFDMSGNALEWTGVCQGDVGEEIPCRLRGGHFATPDPYLRCDYDYGKDTLRDLNNSRIGFRCCQDKP